VPQTLISDAKFRELAQAGTPEAETGVRKAFNADVKAADDGSRVLTFTISTASVDRAGDTIAVDGWKFASYRKNPVVQWAHDYSSLPVGKSLREWIEGGRVKSDAEFTPAGMARFNDTVYEMYKQGFLSAVSVGFAPTKWAWTEDKERRLGIDFMEQELLEYSCVPVPANGEALIEARSAGVDLAPIKEWASALIKRECATIRDFEEFLRDAGYSRNDAKALASHGWNGLTRRDAEIQKTAEFLQQFRNFIPKGL
jgi:HK97 family phage prohead protease